MAFGLWFMGGYVGIAVVFFFEEFFRELAKTSETSAATIILITVFVLPVILALTVGRWLDNAYPDSAGCTCC